MIQLHACVFISTPVSLEGRLENEAELQWMSYYEGTFFFVSLVMNTSLGKCFSA